MTDSQGVYSQMALGYTSDATLDFDRGYDGKNINSEYYLTSLIGTDEYSIQARPEFQDTDIVPLSYKVNSAGTYSISKDHATGIFENMQTIYLKDNVTNTVHNLNSGSYSFTTNSGTFVNRFQILYQMPLSVGSQDFNENQVVVFKNTENELVVQSKGELINSVSVFDINGRMLTVVKDVNTNVYKTKLNIADQILLINVKSIYGNEVTKKVMFKTSN